MAMLTTVANPKAGLDSRQTVVRRDRVIFTRVRRDRTAAVDGSWQWP